MWSKQQQQQSSSSFHIPKQGSFSYNFAHTIINGQPNNYFSQTNRAHQTFRPRETVPWGVSNHSSIFETSYSSQYRDHNSSKVIQRVTPTSFYPNENLSSTFIPCGIPKPSRAKKYIEPAIVSGMDIIEAPRSGRKQFNEIKHKKDYTKDDSPLSYREFDGPLVRSRTLSPTKPNVASIIKNVFLHHSQVKENFATEPNDISYLDNSLSLFSQTMDESRTAGCSDFRKFISPRKTGLIRSASKSDTNMKDFMSNSFIDSNHQERTKAEIMSTISQPIKVLKLRSTGFVNRCFEEYHRRSVSPNDFRKDSPLSRSFYQERSINKNARQTPDIYGNIEIHSKQNSCINEEIKSTPKQKKKSSTSKASLKKQQSLKEDQNTIRNSNSKNSQGDISKTRVTSKSQISKKKDKETIQVSKNIEQKPKEGDVALGKSNNKEIRKLPNFHGLSKASLEILKRLNPSKHTLISNVTKQT